MRRWAERAGRPVGAILSLPQAWALGGAWYHDRLSPAWRRRTTEEAQAVFSAVGLTGPFWNLTG